MPTVTAKAITEVKISPRVKKILLTEVKSYLSLKDQRDVIDHAMKAHRETVEGVLTDLEQTSLVIDGYKTTLVAPTRKKFDAKKFVALGGDLDLYHAANIDTPGALYVKISPPGAKDYGDE